MKHVFLLFSTVLFFYACSSKNETTQQSPANLNGNWVSKEYIELLAENHSPKVTLEKLTLYATELVIDSKKGDSVAVYNGQESYASLPAERRGDTLRVKLNKDAFTDIAYDADTKTLFFVDKSLNRIFRFVRAEKEFIDTSFEMPVAFPSFVNKAVFEGKWTFFEHNSTQKNIEFTRFGKVKGWEKYSDYSLCVNGDCAVNDGGDVVIFTNQKDVHAFGFVSKGDTLTVFDLKAQPNGRYLLGNAVGLLARKK
jgi:hypothetical protein